MQQERFEAVWCTITSMKKKTHRERDDGSSIWASPEYEAESLQNLMDILPKRVLVKHSSVMEQKCISSSFSEALAC